MTAQKRSRFAPRRVPVEFLQGDDQNELDRLQRAIDEALASTAQAGPRLADWVDPLPEAVEAHNAFIEEARARADVLFVRRIGRTRWWELAAENPPRDDEADDIRAGFNLKDFPAAVMMESETFDDPDLADLDARREFLDGCSEADWRRIVGAIWEANLGSSAAPKALTVAELMDAFATSNSPAGTEPPFDGSTETSPPQLLADSTETATESG